MWIKLYKYGDKDDHFICCFHFVWVNPQGWGGHTSISKFKSNHVIEALHKLSGNTTIEILEKKYRTNVRTNDFSHYVMFPLEILPKILQS